MILPEKRKQKTTSRIYIRIINGLLTFSILIATNWRFANRRIQTNNLVSQSDAIELASQSDCNSVDGGRVCVSGS